MEKKATAAIHKPLIMRLSNDDEKERGDVMKFLNQTAALLHLHIFILHSILLAAFSFQPFYFVPPNKATIFKIWMQQPLVIIKLRGVVL